jgi:AcrR family transcriptional regulator
MAKPLQLVESRRPACTGRVSARAAHQRERILDAAERCFIDSGFHAAGMARVAETAGISPGLIYRYFDGKASLVKAIIMRHLDSDAAKMLDEVPSAQILCERLLDMFDHWRRGDDPKSNASLMLDLAAECSRDPQIARVVRDKDRRVEERLKGTVERIVQMAGGKISAAEARSRAIVLQCLFEGLCSRASRDPSLQRKALRSALEQVVEVLLLP